MPFVKLNNKKKANGRWSFNAPPIVFRQKTMYWVDQDVYDSYMVESKKPRKDKDGNHARDKDDSLLYDVEITNQMFVIVPNSEIPDGAMGRKKSLPPLPPEKKTVKAKVGA